jgi:hypothetical protein
MTRRRVMLLVQHASVLLNKETYRSGGVGTSQLGCGFVLVNKSTTYVRTCREILDCDRKIWRFRILKRCTEITVEFLGTSKIPFPILNT